MLYDNELETFWENVKKSIQEGNFAKLTLAKTIGDTEIKNVFIRPVNTPNGLLLTHTVRYKTEEIEEVHTFEETLLIIKNYIKNPFLTVLLFTTEADITLKVNKKNIGTIIIQAPTFKTPSHAMIEMKEQGLL